MSGKKDFFITFFSHRDIFGFFPGYFFLFQKLLIKKKKNRCYGITRIGLDELNTQNLENTVGMSIPRT